MCNCFFFSSGYCSPAPDDLQCTLCQTASIKQASCSFPATFRRREKSLHFISVSVWVCGVKGPAVDGTRQSNLTLKSISHPFLWDDYFAVNYDIVTDCSCCSWNCYDLICELKYIYFWFLTYCGSLCDSDSHHMLTRCERMKWQFILFHVKFLY